jgi:predicted metal-dependent peptidase
VRRAVGETSGASDYSYRHHARRQSLYPDFVIPALRRPVPEVAVLIDTSGSMSEKMLAQAVAEVGGVLRQLGMRHTITVLSVDAAVHTCQRVFSATQIQLVGGGGTDLRKGFKKVCEMHSKPQILIVLTDGETPWPETAPPGIRTIIVLLGTGLTPRWARVVKIATNDN